MKRWILLALLGALFLFVAVDASDAAARLHPALRAALLSSTSPTNWTKGALDLRDVSSQFQITISPTGVEQISVLAKFRDGATADAFRGSSITARAGSILALSVSWAELTELAGDPDVVYIEPSWKTRPTLDRSLPAIGVDLVHAASPAVLGEGAIVGIIDTGIDYTHLDFRFDADGDGFEESSRIDSIWDQTWGIFGAEYSRSEIESDLALGLGSGTGIVRSSDENGHGTHVASIAAGDGSSSSYGFVGVAPEATIVAVKTSFYTADILSGVKYVFERAEAIGLPAVVNLSLGGHDGPHDGTSLFEEGLDELAADPGRAVVVSAGNEGDLPIHTSGTLSGNAAVFEVEPEDWEMELVVWYPGTSEFTITIRAPSGAPVSAAVETDTGYVLTADGTVYVDNASGGVNPNNGDHQAFIRLANVTVGERWEIEIRDVGGSGRFDAWVTTAAGIIVNGDSSSSIDEPGNADRVITVGSFNTKATWASLAGSQDFSGTYPVSALSAFSSRGPTRDGRTKPEISAPGAWICGAGSSDATTFQYLTHPDEVHVMELGTSMAAPHVSGASALLLSRDPDLTGPEIREILKTTANGDSQTGVVPNVRWGWGKLNVEAAVAAVDIAEPTDPPDDTSIPVIGLAANPVSTSAAFEFEVPDGTSSAILRIFSVSGRSVFETAVTPESGSYEWDLRSRSGASLAVGLYLYVLVTDRGVSEVGRLVIER